MNNQQKKWFYLIGLAIIWGSSFILMKKGLIGLSAIQLGALRIVLAALFLFAYSFKSIYKIPRDKWKWIVVTAILSTFIPVFFFALAETEIDSGIVSVLNSLVPFFALMIGAIFFKSKILTRQILGVVIGLIGTVTLIWQGATMSEGQNYWYSLFVISASLGYASNINILKHYLEEVDAVAITVGNFSLLFIPSLIILASTSFFSPSNLSDPIVLQSIGYVALLSLFGTAIAKVLFNQLIKFSSPVFSASVTYLIPIVAIFWGVWDGEKIGWLQMIGAAIILCGVYLVNKKKKLAKSQIAKRQ